MKIVINKCYGGFGLSEKALEYIGIENDYTINRDDPRLIECVEKLGLEANSGYSELKIVEIPDDVEWIIQEYDGIEWIAEKHRTWE
jgi:hypothetical protein